VQPASMGARAATLTFSTNIPSMPFVPLPVTANGVTPSGGATDFTWTNAGSTPLGSGASVAVTVNSFVYFLGGATHTGVRRYEPSTRTWETLADAPGGMLFDGRAAVLGSTIYVGDVPNVGFRSFDTTNTTWTFLAGIAYPATRQCPRRRRGPDSDDRRHLRGGALLSSVEEFNPSGGLWRSRAAMTRHASRTRQPWSTASSTCSAVRRGWRSSALGGGVRSGNRSVDDARGHADGSRVRRRGGAERPRVRDGRLRHGTVPRRRRVQPRSPGPDAVRRAMEHQGRAACRLLGCRRQCLQLGDRDLGWPHGRRHAARRARALAAAHAAAVHRRVRQRAGRSRGRTGSHAPEQRHGAPHHAVFHERRRAGLLARRSAEPDRCRRPRHAPRSGASRRCWCAHGLHHDPDQRFAVAIDLGGPLRDRCRGSIRSPRRVEPGLDVDVVHRRREFARTRGRQRQGLSDADGRRGNRAPDDSRSDDWLGERHAARWHHGQPRASRRRGRDAGFRVSERLQRPPRGGRLAGERRRDRNVTVPGEPQSLRSRPDGCSSRTHSTTEGRHLLR